MTVSIPYTPTAEELKNPDSITVFYIDGSGNLVEMKDAKYDATTKRIVFTTTHFSYYAVGYKETLPTEVTAPTEALFDDVSSSAWYYNAVNFIAEKGITTGTEDEKFSPNASLTRGQFLVMLMKAYDFKADQNPSDNFTDAGDTYYTGYLATAKAEGITGGIGNNKFGPEQAITRQEMFTLLYNVLKGMDEMPQGDSGKIVSDYADASEIDGWAMEAMITFVENGIVSGNDGKLNPHSSTTRGEMAQVLYCLLSE